MTRPSGVPRRSDSRQAGSTLIELLVALALLALSMTMLPGILKLGTQTWAARGDVERLDGLDFAMQMVERRVAQALPLFERDDSGRVRILFRGDARSIEFVGAAENGPAGAGLYRSRIVLRDVDGGAGLADGLVLELAVHAADHDAASDLAVSRHVIAAQGLAVEFRYYGAPSRGAAASWRSDWTRRDALPTLIEATARSTVRGSEHVRRIVIEPRVAPRQ